MVAVAPVPAPTTSAQGSGIWSVVLEDPGISFSDALVVMENLICALAWLIHNPSPEEIV